MKAATCTATWICTGASFLLAGCFDTNARAHEYEAQVRRQDEQREAEARAAAACRSAEADPKADPKYVHQCVVTRWAYSRIDCTDVRLSEKIVQVTCQLPIWPGLQPDFYTATEKAIQHAAYAALAAGKPYFIGAGADPVVGHYRNSTTPVTCDVKNRGLYAAAAVFASAGSSPGVQTNCSTFGNMTNCNSTGSFAPRPIPQPQYECTGGQATSDLVGAGTSDRYELLTPEEAAARNDPDLPAGRRPFSARAIAQLFSGMQ
jgi:hypothetical protein